MDSDELELCLTAVETWWPTPLADGRVENWARALRTGFGPALDAELVADVLAELKRQNPRRRPPITVFLAAYRRAAASARVTAREAAAVGIQQCRAALASSA